MKTRRSALVFTTVALLAALPGCSSGPSAHDLAREACDGLGTMPDGSPAAQESAEDYTVVVREVSAELEPRVELLADAAGQDDRYRPAYLAASDLLNELADWNRFEDDPDEFEQVREKLLDLINDVRTECRIVTAN